MVLLTSLSRATRGVLNFEFFGRGFCELRPELSLYASRDGRLPRVLVGVGVIFFRCATTLDPQRFLEAF